MAEGSEKAPKTESEVKRCDDSMDSLNDLMDRNCLCERKRYLRRHTKANHMSGARLVYIGSFTMGRVIVFHRRKKGLYHRFLDSRYAYPARRSAP